MNVRIRTNIAFTAGVYYDGEMLMNHYQIQLNMTTISNDHYDQNVALERVKYFIHSQLSNSVFIHQSNEEQCSLLTKAGIKITDLPEEPVDQIVGIMLFNKLNAVMEDRLVVTEIAISSELGDNIVYFHNDQESLGPFESAGWWNDSSTCHCDSRFFDNDSVVALNYSKTWRELNLAWQESIDTDSIIDNDNKLVFADFQRDETK